MIHRSPLPDVEIPDVPLTSYVLAGAAAQGDKPALIDGASGRALSYAGLDSAVRSLAGGLVASGFAKGDVLAVMAPNVPEYAVVFHGAAMAGGVVTTINPTYTETELGSQLRDSGARILVTIPPLAAAAARGCAGTRVAEIYVLGEVAEIYVLGEAQGAKPLAGLLGAPLDGHVPVGPDDVVALPYSSGTTGLCKGVMLTQRNMVANIAQMLATAQIRSDERLVAVLPFFHIYGMQVLMNCSLRAGRDRRHAAPVRPRAVPAGSSGPPDHAVVRGSAHRARAGQAPAGGQLRPQHADADPLRGRAAESRPGRRVRQAAGLRGGPGLRHDRAVAGLAHHAAGLVQAGIGGHHGAEHADADRRPGQRGRRRHRRRGRDLGTRARR